MMQGLGLQEVRACGKCAHHSTSHEENYKIGATIPHGREVCRHIPHSRRQWIREQVQTSSNVSPSSSESSCACCTRPASVRIGWLRASADSVSLQSPRSVNDF